MTSSSMLDHLVRVAHGNPDAALFQFPETDARPTITYVRAVALIDAIASQLSDRGVRPGDRVVAQVPSCPESVLLCLATQWSGGVFVPLNPALGPAESDCLIKDAEPRVAILGADALTELAAAGTAHADSGGSSTVAPIAQGADSPAAIIYTSGTTGRPKGAIVTHGNLTSNAESLCRIWGFTPGDVTVHALPTFHAHGLFVAVNTAIVAGSGLLFLGRFDTDRVIDALAGAGTVLMGVPTFYVRLLASERFTRAVARDVRLFISGSAPLTDKTFAAFADRTGTRILERYGMSETEMIASNPLDGERIAGSVGFALPDVEIQVRCDDDPAVGLAPCGEPGGIEVRGPNVFAGYRGMPERRALDFTQDGWFRTGDLGTLDASGRLRIVGRAKDLIISGGENVYPAEIETLLDQLPGVAESAVIGMSDDDFGELGLAVVVRDESGEPINADMVLTALRSDLAGFKIPREVMFADALPRNAMGKVQKGALRERLSPEWAARRAAQRHPVKRSTAHR